DQTVRVCSHPETRQQFLFKGTPDLVQRFNLLSGCTFLSLFNSVEAEYTSRLVNIDTYCGVMGNPINLLPLSFVPNLIAGTAPFKTPGFLVLSKATGPFTVPPSCSFKRYSDHDPSRGLYLPVASGTQEAFFAKNLFENKQTLECFQGNIMKLKSNTKPVK
ncbi:hypothetical protein XENOCAPTIV_001610, partial [Xenoophorus captivus]